MAESGTSDSERFAVLFERALDVPLDDRTAWLAEVCGNDIALREKLTRLLRADARAAGILDAPPPLMAEAIAAGSAADEAPRTLGPYKVLRSIGAGGMGEVWLAERNDGEFEQRVAIKQLAWPTPGLLQRFRQERQILAHLEHPNIARLLDGGVDAQGAPYLVMEYIEGVPVTDYARTHALDLPARLRLFLQVCDAVQYAHQNLVVHRDLKPSNIFVTADGTPKLLDFGIAKVLATTGDDAATQTMARMLTPDYAAPEQFNGGPITTATDVYALGVVLYEVLAGVRPSRPARPDATGSSRTTEPVPPSAALDRTTGSARRRALRGDLDRITLTALAAEPNRRYPSAAALAADIRRYLDGRPIAARGDSAMYRLRKYVRRNRYALATAMFVFAVCITATIVSLRQASRANAQAQRAEQQMARADAVHRFLVKVFEQASPDASKGKAITAHDLLDKSEPLIAKELSTQPALRVDVTTLLGHLYDDIGDIAQAKELFTRAVAESADPRVPAEIKAGSLTGLARLENDSRETDAAYAHAEQALAVATSAGSAGLREASDARHAMNKIRVARGDSRAAEPGLRETLAADLAAFGDSNDPVAEDWQLLGTVLDELSRYDESAEAFRNAIRILRELHGDQSEAVVGANNDLGLMLLHKGDLAGAERALHDTMTTAIVLYGADTDSTWTAHSNYLRVLELQGRFREALAQRLDILDAEQKHPGEARPASLAFATNFIGADHRELGELTEAETFFRRSLALWKQIKGTNDEPSSAAPLGNLGVTLLLAGRYDEAGEALQKAYAIENRHGSPTSQWVNLARGELGNLMRLQHQFADALHELDAAAAAVSAQAGTDRNPWIAQLMAQLGEAALDAGDSARARLAASKALATVRKVVKPDSPRMAAPLFAMARVELADGNAHAAELLLREALAVRDKRLPQHDPRMLELNVGLVRAVAAQGRIDEARAMGAPLEKILNASTSPYASDLRARLADL